MSLKNLSDNELVRQTKEGVVRERESTLYVLHRLREIERRMIYAEKYNSLFTYCVEELGYDAGAAYVRISSMRLIKDMPELEQKVETGELNLTLLTQAQTFFRKEKIRSLPEKQEIISSLSGKSTREAQKELLDRAKVPEVHRPERIQAVSSNHAEIRFIADVEMLNDLESLKELLSHSASSLKEILHVAIRDSIEKRTPKISKTIQSLRAKNESARQPSLKEIKRIVWNRDGGRCTHVHGGERCNSRFQIEYDHIQPVALGGESTAENLRLLCRKHNQLAALKRFGAEKMAQFIPSLRTSPKSIDSSDIQKAALPSRAPPYRGPLS